MNLKHALAAATVAIGLHAAPGLAQDAAVAANSTARARGVLAVEMEAAGLYAFAAARGQDILCLAQVASPSRVGDAFRSDAAYERLIFGGHHALQSQKIRSPCCRRTLRHGHFSR